MCPLGAVADNDRGICAVRVAKKDICCLERTAVDDNHAGRVRTLGDIKGLAVAGKSAAVDSRYAS